MVGQKVPAMRFSTLLLAGALLIGACSDTATDPTTSTTPLPTTSTTLAPTTTTAAAPTTTTTSEPPATTTLDPLARPDVLVSNVNRDSIDDFDTTGDDLYRVVMEVRDLFVYLEGSPTGTAEEMVSLVFEADYPFWDSIMVGFRELTDNPGWRYVDPGVETLGLEMVSVDGDIAVFRVANQRGEQTIADGSGEVVKTYEGWERAVTTITFKRGSDGRWRYSDLDPSEPIEDGDLAEMVPVEWTGRQP